MALDRVNALQSVRTDLVGLLHDLSADEWKAPSRCQGWNIQDVVSHMAAACHGSFTGWFVGLMLSKDVEAGNDRDVARRHDREPAKVLKEYESWSKRALVMHKVLQRPPSRQLPIKVAEIGAYPAKQLTSAFVFDHGLHLTYDIATALGRTVPTPDANRIAVSNEWMMVGLPAMSGERLSWLDQTVEVNLVGPGASTWTVAPGGRKGRVKVTEGPAPEATTSIEGDAASFGTWGTGRQPWREAGVSLKGDEQLGARLLDSMRII